MKHEPNSRLPKIALGLSLGSIAAYIASYLFVLHESIKYSHGDWGILGLLLLLLKICSILHLCAASAGMSLSIYAITQKIRMKASITALVFSVLSLAMALIVITFWGFLIF